MLNCDFRNIGSIPITYQLMKFVKHKYVSFIHVKFFSTNISSINKNKFFWKLQFSALLNQYFINSKNTKQKINLYIAKNIKNLSYYSLGEESFEKIYHRWLKKGFKKLKKKNDLFFTILFKNIQIFFFNDVRYSLLNIFSQFIFNEYTFILKYNIIADINNFIQKITNLYIYKINSITNMYKQNIDLLNKILQINLTGTQIFTALINNKMFCEWTCSTGLVLKKLNMYDKKYLKKSHIFWSVFFKIFENKFKNFFKKNKTTNILILKGQHKYYLKLLLILWKLTFFPSIKYLILKFNLSFSQKKYKKIKAIKRKLTKRFLKIELKQNMELKSFKKIF